MLTFDSPLWLLALPIPFTLWALIRWQRHLSGLSMTGASAIPAAITHPQADLLAELVKESGTGRRIPWWWLIGCMLLLTAMARPQWLDFNTPGTQAGHDMMLAVDVSGSMRALDYVVDGIPTSRLDMLKGVTIQFLERRANDRIGVIIFADDALTFMPMTTDIAMIRSLVDDISHGVAGEKTALGDTIALAVERMREGVNTSRILILLTDGANTTGSVSPESATLLARQQGIRIYTIGVGTDNKVAFPRGAVLEPVYTELPLNEELLRAIAKETGGHYYRAGNTAELQQIYKDIDQVETTEMRNPDLAQRQDWYWLPLLTGLALLLFSEYRRHNGILP